MKKIHILLLLVLSVATQAQSISASKILQYASAQNIGTISKELKQLGFQTRTDNSEGYTIYQFAKKSARGIERVEVSKNSELFMFTYSTQPEYYQILKTKLLLPSFQYAYAYRNTNYYENGSMRIGINNNSNIISFFKPLK